MNLDHREQEIYNNLTPGQRHEIDDLLRAPTQAAQLQKGILIALGTLILLAILF
jgi:hypothetical protein